MSGVVQGARCDAHVGDAHAPRCADCEAESALAVAVRPVGRLGFVPGSSCQLHPDYPLPCGLCARIYSSAAPKLNGPCPVCWEPAHWSLGPKFLHPGCDLNREGRNELILTIETKEIPE